MPKWDFDFAMIKSDEVQLFSPWVSNCRILERISNCEVFFPPPKALLLFRACVGRWITMKRTISGSPPRFKTRQKRAEGLKNKRNPGRWALSVAIQFHWCSVSGDKICEQLSTGPFGRVLVVRLSDSASRSFPRQTCKAFMDPMNQQLRGTYRKAQLANAMSS